MLPHATHAEVQEEHSCMHGDGGAMSVYTATTRMLSPGSQESSLTYEV